LRDRYQVHRQPADVITSWFPFLTPAALLAWRLLPAFLASDRLFGQIRHNLRPGEPEE
jgi:hypothetical protein